MAARINTRVVVPLIVVLLVLVGGVIGLAYFTIYRTAEFYKSRGDAAAAAGDWRAAVEFYSKGVNRDQGNIELLDLWRESIRKIVPTDAIEAMKFYKDATGIVRKKTESRPFEPQFHIDWLNQALSVSMPDLVPADAAFLADQAEKMLLGKPASDDNPLWEQAYRFRGIANTYRMRDPGFDPPLRDQALSDLQRWLKTDPDDSLAEDALIKWHLLSAGSLLSGSKPAEALAEIDAAQATALEYLQTHADDVLINTTLSEVFHMRRMAEQLIPGTESDAAARQREALDSAERAALAQENVPWWLTQRLAGDLAVVDADPLEGVQRAATLIEHALESAPENPQLRFERARYLALAGRREESMAAFQEIIDSPNLPINLTSVQLFRVRPLAVIALFDMDLEKWRRTDPSQTEACAQARAKVQSRIDQYRAMVSSTDPQLLYLEGRFALVDREPEVAANRLNQFLTTVGSSNIPQSQLVQTLVDLATALQMSNRPGAAYEFMAQADAMLKSRDLPVLRTLITIDLNSKNFARAQQNLDRLIAIDPDSPETKQLRNNLVVARDGINAGVVEDETLSAILKARELQQADEIDQSRTLLLKLHDGEPDNLQVLYELARLEQSQGNTAKSLEYVETALAVDPASESWRILQALLNGTDLRPVLAQLVDERPGLSEFDRHVAKWHAYAQHGFPDEAKTEFEAAKAINPAAPEIIEQDFAIAMLANDMPAAQNAVRQAQQTNADLANGLTFRGRYELQTGDSAAAIATLLQASNLKPYDGAVWRFLGVAYREAGNYSAAMDALSKSLEKEPGNISTLKELARLQMQRQDFDKALDTIRKAQAYAPGDASIQNTYLELEGRYGNRTRIIRIREQMMAKNVGGIENAIALVELHELDTQFEKAKEVLDSLVPQDQREQLLVAQARSAWFVRQGMVDEGRDALLAFIDSSPQPPNDLMMKAMLSLMQYYINAGQSDKAIETAKRAEPFQDPKLREADRSLGEIYMSLHESESALETYEKAFAGTPDSPELSVQIINLHLTIAGQDAESDPAAAEQHRKRAGDLLNAHEKAHGASVETLLLRGELAIQSGNTAEAERIFNDTVARHPQDARVYSARAKFNLAMIVETGDIGRANRVRADVDQAMQLNPGSASPLWILVDLARARRNPSSGEPDPDVDTMMSTWRRILEIEPRNEDVRKVLIQNLFVKGEYAGARVLIDDAIAMDPSNAQWYEMRGDLERQSDAPPERYFTFYQSALDKEFSPMRLAQLADALLKLNPPRADEVLQLYRKYGSEVAGMPVHRLLLARAQTASGDATAAVASLRAAAEMILATPDPATRDSVLKMWYGYLPVIIPPNQFKTLSDAAFGSFDDPWPQALLGMALYTASTRSGAVNPGALNSAGIKEMAAAKARIQSMPASERRTQQIHAEVGVVLAEAYYASGAAADAVETWRWLLEVAPDDIRTLNNLGFVLAHDLNEPAAALEPAKRAYDALPADSTVLDTYGYVLFRNGRLDEAERYLRDSLDRQDQSGTRMHLGQVLAAKGNVEAARTELGRARKLAEQQGNAARVTEIDELLKNL